MYKIFVSYKFFVTCLVLLVCNRTLNVLDEVLSILMYMTEKLLLTKINK